MAGKGETHAEPRVCYTDGRSEFLLHGGDAGQEDLQETKRSIISGFTQIPEAVETEGLISVRVTGRKQNGDGTPPSRWGGGDYIILYIFPKLALCP